MKEVLKNWFFRVWYWYISNIDKNAEVTFMNFGFSSPDQKLELSLADEPNRYSIQLYHQLADKIDLGDKSLLEIGSGRGGGLHFLRKKFNINSAMGVDLNERAAKFCNEFYQEEGLSFISGDAQKLPITDHSFDVVLNVESSHRYPDFISFLNEVYRILKPGGYFLFTDFRYDYEMEEINRDLDKLPFERIADEMITANVVTALELDDQRRRELITKLAPKFLHKIALNFAGTVGSETYDWFAERKYEYFNYVLRKPVE